MRKLSLFAFISLSFPIVMEAAANATVDDEPTLIVVTATRIPTPEIQVASSISVVTADQIAARQIQTLPELLQQTPGLNVVQTGGPGGQTSIFMRGTNSNHTKVFVDGVDVGDPSSPTGGAFDFGQFLTQDIQRVEILRGPQSGLYGSDAIGGVINIITKRGDGPAQATVSLEGGSFGTFDQSAGVSGSDDRFHYAANLEHFHSGETPVTPLDTLAPGERRIDDYYDNRTASTKLGFDISQSFDLGLVARYTNSHLRLTGEDYSNYPAPNTPESAQSADTTSQYYTRATAHAVLFDGRLEQTLGAAYGNIRSSDLDPENPRSDFFGQRVKFDWQGNVRVADAEKLVLGAEHQRDSITQPISASTTIDSGYAELESGFGERLYDTLSIRYDDNDRFGGKVTYRIAPTYLFPESGTKLKASVGTGFKAPTLSQMFQSFPDFGFSANPNLKPESSLGYDVGVEQDLFADEVRVGVTYFHNMIKNLIIDNADSSSYANIGRAVTQGAEAFIAYQPLSMLTLRLDYTYTQADDEIAGEELLRRPKHKAVFNTEWRATQRLSLNATVLTQGSWIDGNRDFSIPRLTAGGFTTVNVASSFALNQHLDVYGRIDNLFNRHYQDPVGFLQPSVGAYAGLRAKF